MTTMPAAAMPAAARPRPPLRLIALPTEHGGWGFLFEPILLAMIVAPSWGGLLISVAALFGFLTRQPLRLALQDAMRGRSYPRTRWCWMFFALFAAAALLILGAAVAVSGLPILIPFGLVAPLALMQVAYDANARGRSLLPELGGAVALSSTAASIAIAAHWSIVPALVLPAIIICRAIPSILYVRTLLRREHKQTVSSWPAVILHVAAVAALAYLSTWWAVAAMLILLARAAWGLTHEPPRAKTLGWREIAFGSITIGLVAVGYVG